MAALMMRQIVDPRPSVHKNLLHAVTHGVVVTGTGATVELDVDLNTMLDGERNAFNDNGNLVDTGETMDICDVAVGTCVRLDLLGSGHNKVRIVGDAVETLLPVSKDELLSLALDLRDLKRCIGRLICSYEMGPTEHAFRSVLMPRGSNLLYNEGIRIHRLLVEEYDPCSPSWENKSPQYVPSSPSYCPSSSSSIELTVESMNDLLAALNEQAPM